MTTTEQIITTRTVDAGRLVITKHPTFERVKILSQELDDYLDDPTPAHEGRVVETIESILSRYLRGKFPKLPAMQALADALERDMHEAQITPLDSARDAINEVLDDDNRLNSILLTQEEGRAIREALARLDQLEYAQEATA
jgi:hypothetical protein